MWRPDLPSPPPSGTADQSRQSPRPSSLTGIFVADYLPAVVNATRVFFGVGAVVLFWIITEWSSGLQAVTFATVTMMVASPMLDESGRAALGQGFMPRSPPSRLRSSNSQFYQTMKSSPGLQLIIATVLVPLGALSSVPTPAPFFVPATLNFTRCSPRRTR